MAACEAVAVRHGGVQGALGVGVVQRGKKLALRHVHAFVKKDAGNAAGDFCRHRSPSAGRDVAAGVEQSLCLRRVRRARRRHLHHRFARPQGENRAGEQHQHSQ